MKKTISGMVVIGPILGGTATTTIITGSAGAFTGQGGNLNGRRLLAAVRLFLPPARRNK